MTASLPVTDQSTLKHALDHADMRILVMALYQITGDEKWMGAEFAPIKDARLISDEKAGFDDLTIAEIKQAAFDILTDDRQAAALPCPEDDRMVRMMSHCLGQRVGAEYAPMMKDQLGFIPLLDDVAAVSNDQQPDKPVLIVGAGVSGMALGVALKKLNIPFQILEAAEEVGGTWWYNRYPGCGVDTPNHSYSFSYAKPYRWSSYFSPRTDLIDYTMGFADEMELRRDVRLNTRVLSANWDEEAAEWAVTVDTADGQQIVHTPYLVSCVGHFNVPIIPEIKGRDRFNGTQFHTARWPDDLDLTDKRVAIVGTGASAMQIVPNIVKDVASLTIYQRSPHWVRPIDRFHDRIPDAVQYLLEHVPFYNSWFRFTMMWRYGDGLLPFLRIDPDWPHPARSLNRGNEAHRVEMTTHIEERLKDRPDLLAKCVPDYPPFGKRILLENGWYETLCDPKVDLITGHVDEVTENGVCAADGTVKDADVIIWSTGFDVAAMACQLNITGKGGKRLEDAWDDGKDPRAHLGMTVPGFPNMAIMLGPNTGLGHGGSTITQAEVQARYIASLIAEMAHRGTAHFEVKQDVHDAYINRVDEEHKDLIWQHKGMTTYYRNDAGRVYSVMPWRIVDYWSMCRTPDLNDFQIT